MSLENFYDQKLFTITKERPSGWIEGHLNSAPDYEVALLAFEHASDFGIRSGRISKLSVYDPGGNEVIHYDRGWDSKPKGLKHRLILAGIEKAFRPMAPDYQVIRYGKIGRAIDQRPRDLSKDADRVLGQRRQEDGDKPRFRLFGQVIDFDRSR